MSFGIDKSVNFLREARWRNTVRRMRLLVGEDIVD